VHIAEWLRLSRSDEGVQEYMDHYVYGVKHFDEYVELIGGAERKDYLAKLERLEVPLDAPWARRQK
jgi:3-oxoacid CoA-transferase subunit A/glutaconate CoA-transferase subunit A